MSRFDNLFDGPSDETWADIAGGLRRLLRRHRRIAIVWSPEDVQWVRPDLNDEQAWAVLEHVHDRHDATVGICWDTLSEAADVMYPEQEETP